MSDSSVAAQPNVELSNPVIKASGYYFTYSQGAYKLGFYDQDGTQLMTNDADAGLIGAVQAAFAQGATVNATLFVNRPQWIALSIEAPKPAS
ncbi:hypothetical protein [Longimicrobium sp.]|uniref:hypothetical protein n=1 Tax=Longimicrobium sp. TaxID=2029185 RepID=UPI002E353933|nr:hypothetical protein [Longimicrobium sp.]HEX6040333.1 hypothetical protein [Longimicrobium sp.]